MAGLSHLSQTGKCVAQQHGHAASNRNLGSSGGRKEMNASTKPRRPHKMVMCITPRGPVARSLGYFNTTRSIAWVLPFFFAIIDYVLTVFIGHCWADTEPNLSQISVPQGPAPIQASSIVMAYFDKFVKKS
jgi:hypothetical protein